MGYDTQIVLLITCVGIGYLTGFFVGEIATLREHARLERGLALAYRLNEEASKEEESEDDEEQEES